MHRESATARSRRRWGRVGVAAIAGVATFTGWAFAAQGDVELVSRESGSTTGNPVPGSDPAVSDDGRYVVFVSSAPNVTSTIGGTIYVRDRETSSTTLVSRSSASDGNRPVVGSDPVLSADGRYIAFSSEDNDLSEADVNQFTNIFVRDLQTETTTLVSRASADIGGAGAGGSSGPPAISADGRHVAFSSTASNLSPTDDNADRDVFVRDLQTETTTLVSRQSDGDGGILGDDSSSSSPRAISGDGRYVAFSSHADNLSTADDDSVSDTFVRDLVTNTTALVSRQSETDGGAGGDDHSFDAAISRDGQSASFTSNARNLTQTRPEPSSQIFMRRIPDQATIFISRQDADLGSASADRSSSSPAVSSDGEYVAFVSEATNLTATDLDAVNDVFVRHPDSNTTRLVSRQGASVGGAAANDHSKGPTVSASGEQIAFESNATNLGQTEKPGVYLRDLPVGKTEVISRNHPSPDGYPAFGDSRKPSLALGDRVAFESSAPNLGAVGEQIVLRDQQTRRTQLISRASSLKGGARGDAESRSPAVSEGGGVVAFESDAENFSNIDRQGTDIFIHFLTDPPGDETTRLGSRQSSSKGGDAANGSSTDPDMMDGRFVAFSSSATNLSTKARGQAVYLRDMATGHQPDSTTRLVSRQSASKGGAGSTGSEPSVTFFARYVAFTSSAKNLSNSDLDATSDVYVRDMPTITTRLVSKQSPADGEAGGDGDSFEPSISYDGRYIAFASAADNLSDEDNDDVVDVFVRDMGTGNITLVSRQSDLDGSAGADGDSRAPSISSDGRYIAFHSTATNLSDIDGPHPDVFVRDLQTGETRLASRQSALDGGAGADGDSLHPSLSPDGQSVAFESNADNLSPDDHAVWDIFLAQLLP